MSSCAFPPSFRPPRKVKEPPGFTWSISASPATFTRRYRLRGSAAAPKPKPGRDRIAIVIDIDYRAPAETDYAARGTGLLVWHWNPSERASYVNGDTLISGTDPFFIGNAVQLWTAHVMHALFVEAGWNDQHWIDGLWYAPQTILIAALREVL